MSISRNLAWEQYEYWTRCGLSRSEMLAAVGVDWDWSFQPEPSFVADQLARAWSRLAVVGLEAA